MTFIALSLTLVQCTELNAGKVKQDFNSWFTDLITPRASSLEMANDGYTVKGNLKNKPNQVIRLFEMTAEGLVFIDSTFTDKKVISMSMAAPKNSYSVPLWYWKSRWCIWR